MRTDINTANQLLILWDFFWNIIHGKGDMGSFQDEVSEKELRDVINSIRSEPE
jgi:hypothetical protein